jgi:hypothetical protein
MKSGLLLNILAIALLTACAVGVFTVPRYNHNYFIDKLDRLDRCVNRLEDGFQRINFLAGDNEEKRTAVVSKIDNITTLMDLIRKDLAEVSQIVAEHVAEDNGSERQKLVAEEEAPQQSFTARTKSYTDPIELTEELRMKARTVSAREMAEMHFEKFLGEIIDKKLTPFERLEDIPASALRHIELIYLLHKDNVLLVDQDERHYVHSEVENLKLSGTYVEVPIGDDGSMGTSSLLEGKGVVVSVKSPTNQAARLIFKLPIEKHPKLEEFDSLRENARDHLVQDLSRIRVEEAR